MNSVNKVFILGKVSGEIKQLITAENYTIYNFYVITYYGYTDRVTGKDIKKNEYHKICAYGEHGIRLMENAREGDLIAIDGYLRSRKYTGKDGATRLMTEIIVKDVMLVEDDDNEDSIDGYDDIRGNLRDDYN